METEKPWRGVLDGNSVDYFQTVPNCFEFLKAARDDARIDPLFTHDVVEEILADTDAERRVTNILHLLSYARMVPSGILVLHYARWNMARFGDEAVPFGDLRAHDDGSGKKNDTRDAIIAATARQVRGLACRVKRQGTPQPSQSERRRGHHSGRSAHADGLQLA